MSGGGECVRYLKRDSHDLRGEGRRSISSIIFSRKTSAGVLHPRHLRGVLLSWSQSCLSSSSVMAATSRCLGSQRLVFSTVPFRQGEKGSQNHVWVPSRACRCGHDTNSVPRSKVMDLRPATGRSRTAFTIVPPSADCFAIACRAVHDRFRAPVGGLQQHSEAADTFDQRSDIGLAKRLFEQHQIAFPMAEFSAVCDVVRAESGRNRIPTSRANSGARRFRARRGRRALRCSGRYHQSSCAMPSFE